MIKAVFFDFDGVLTIDATGSTSICNYISKVTGIEKSDFRKEYSKYNYDLLYGMTTHEKIWNELNEGLNTNIDIKHMYDSFINTPMDKKMLDLANKLKRNGYVTGIITDNKSDRINHISNFHDLSSTFDCIAISSDIGSGKEHQPIFDYVLKETSLKANECVFIDNSRTNLVKPNEMGMKTIFYNHIDRDFKGLLNELIKIGVTNV
ncbi:MAG: HAD-IA family hydrolase [Clostridiales bacterium]|nr:HAD-IA family hydrolase [Clostridiales bacterium]